MTTSVDSYDAGTLLHRLALYCRRDIALVTGEAEYTWSELASTASDFASANKTSTPAGVAFRIEPREAQDQLAGAWGAMLSTHPLFVPASSVDCNHWDEVVQQRTLSWGDPDEHSWRARAHDPNPLRCPAIAVQSKHEPSRAHVWTHGAICRLWGVMAPPPNSVSLASPPVLDQIGWSTTFAALLGHGRVVASVGAWDERLTAVQAEHVKLITVREEELPQLLGSIGTYHSVEQVTVWSHGIVSLETLEALQALFPASQVRRCLYADWGPLTVATLPELRERDARWVGQPVLGMELAAVDRGAYQGLLARSPMAAYAVGIEDRWQGGGEASIDTALAVAASAGGWRLLVGEAGSD